MATSLAAGGCDALEHIGAREQLRATVWSVRNAADSMHACRGRYFARDWQRRDRIVKLRELTATGREAQILALWRRRRGLSLLI